MKKLIFFFFIFLMISSCASSNPKSTQQLKMKIVDLVKAGKFDQISEHKLEEKQKVPTTNEFNDPQRSINAIKGALKEGYLPLLEDISKDKYTCINEKDIINKYKFADWETRHIGFANWPLRVEGALLLKQIKILEYQILIMKLCNKKELHPFIEKKQNSLQKAINTLNEKTKEKNWVD